MPQYYYSPTQLGMEVWNRGGLSPEEDAVFHSMVNLERVGDFGTISLLRQRLVVDSKYLDQRAKVVLSDEELDKARELRYAAGKKVQVSEPVRLRQIVQELVKRGLVLRTR